MGIEYGRGWGGARISLSRGSVLSREYLPSSWVCFVLFLYLYGEETGSLHLVEFEITGI